MTDEAENPGESLRSEDELSRRRAESYRAVQDLCSKVETKLGAKKKGRSKDLAGEGDAGDFSVVPTHVDGQAMDSNVLDTCKRGRYE